MSPSTDPMSISHARPNGVAQERVVRPGAVRATTGILAVGTLMLGFPTAALALPAGTSAPVVEVVGRVVAFYAGTAEVDGSTTLEPTKSGTRSRLDCTILFGKDSDVLRPGAKERLHRLADQLHDQGAGQVAVTGYTDDLGSAAHGLDLSERRARRVAHELRQVLPAKRFPMAVEGLGEAHPAVANTSEANRRKNRRVVVTLTRTPTNPPPVRPSTPPQKPELQPIPKATTSTSTTPTPTPSAATTPAAAAPPPRAIPSPAGPAGRVPWPWIGGAGAALVGGGALVDALRRRRRISSQPTANAGTADEEDASAEADAEGSTTSTSRTGSQPNDVIPTPDDADVRHSPRQDQTVGAASPALLPAGSKVRLAADSGGPTNERAHASKLEAALAVDLAAWQSGGTHRPRLSVLGPVHVRTQGKALARRRPYYTELFAYLVLRPEGATVDEIADDFSLSPARVRTDMKILRDWLGTDPGNGAAYLPDARITPAALRRGVGVYQLDGVLCDWLLFQRLQAVARGKDERERVVDLQAAFDLVTGRPFEQARPAGWGWLFEGDRADLHAAKAIVDVAVNLTDYHRAHQEDDAADRVVAMLAKIDPERAHEIAADSAS